jgi:uncharacterized phage protein (TIGR01671 family)
MKREIKFRVWDKHLSCFFENIEFLSAGYWDSSGSPIFLAECECGDYQDCGDSFEDNFILLQYTGVNDVNKKEIYEGDIVSCGSLKGSVEYHEGCFFLDHEPLYGILALGGRMKVIGNIFENPELIQCKA